MMCEKCGLAMRIVKAGTRPEVEADGTSCIWHVNEVACQNPQCGAKGAVREQKTLLWQGSALAGEGGEAFAAQAKAALRAEVEEEARSALTSEAWETLVPETKAELRAEVKAEVRGEVEAEVRAELAGAAVAAVAETKKNTAAEPIAVVEGDTKGYGALPMNDR